MENISLESMIEKIEQLHPQMAAVLLFSLTPQMSGTILSTIPLGLAFELTERILATKDFDESIFKGLEEMFDSIYPDPSRLEENKSELLVYALEYTSYIRRKDIIIHLTEDCSITLPQKKIKIMEDLLTLNSPALTEQIISLDLKDLKCSLRIASESLKDYILSFFSEEISSEIKSDLDFAGPVPIDEIEDACQRIIDVLNNSLVINNM
ncbi:MAG TPA: FliG C-terminal domain-containing protein [Spirochaetota bacterium]|nr:FliG C-terminal domain-containing protein [Spirochaetota bacterium]